MVIDSAAYRGIPVSGTTAINAQEYVTPRGVLLLYGANGGNTSWGANLKSAIHTPSNTGRWDGSMNISLSGSTHTVVVPQVLVYYSGTTPAATMQGYDGQYIEPLCNSAIGASYVQAYKNGNLTDGYIFNLGDGLPCYRYQFGPGPLVINTQSGWPPSDVVTFPQSIKANGQSMNSTAFVDGINNGYWCDAYYGTQTGNNSVDIHVYISSDSSTGDIWGNVGTLSFSNDLTPSQTTFTSQPALGIDTAAPQGTPQYGPPQVDWDGLLLPFLYETANGGDVYYDPATTSTVIVTSDDTVTAHQPYQTLTGYYDPNAQVISDGNGCPLQGLVGVSADGATMLGFPDSYNYLTIKTTGWDPGYLCTIDGFTCAWTYALYLPDGTASYVYFPEDTFANTIFPLNDPFTISGAGGGTQYLYPGGIMVLDFTSSTPPSNVPTTLAAPPSPRSHLH